MSLFRRHKKKTERQSDKETFLDSLHNKTQLNITNYRIELWTMRGEYLYFKDYKTISVYSIAQRRVERQLQHEKTVVDFEFVGESFLVSVGWDFVRVWSATDGALLASKEYEWKSGYLYCVAVSPTSFLYIADDTIRRLDIAISNSTAVQLKQVNTTAFNENAIWPSEVRGGKIALVFGNKMKLNIFDLTTFKVTAKIDLSSHLTEGFDWDYKRNFGVAFPDRVVFCVGDSAHSQLKILTFDPSKLKLRNSFIVTNPIHSILEQHSNVSEYRSADIWIDARKSFIRMQYKYEYDYQILDISLDTKKITSSYGFHIEKNIIPNCKSLCNGVIEADEEDRLMLRHARNDIMNISNNIHGPVEQLYKECTRSGKRAVHLCEQLSPTLFNGSLLEFFFAHRLLMIAIQDGDVQKSLHHNGVSLKWHEAIYSASRKIALEKTEDRMELTLILIEAAKYNVIESVSQYLLANDITSEVRDQNENMFNLGRQMFVRLIQLEAAHMNLDLAFERYKKVQGMTELMGIALNVVPFLGGSVAAAVTAGADLVEGLQISDMMDGALQVSVDMISNSQTFEQGVLRCVESSLRKDEIKKRIELLASLQKCGLTIDQLQELLKNGIHRNEEKEEKKSEESNPVDNIAEISGGSSRSDKGTACEVAIVDEPSAEKNLISTEEEIFIPKRETRFQEAGPPSQTKNSSDTKVNLSHLDEWSISDFKNLYDNRDTVRLLTVRQCSYFLAALMLLFDDDFDDEFRTLQPILFGINKSRMISGKVLCDYSKYCESVDGILADLQKRYPVNEIMIGEFMDFVK